MNTVILMGRVTRDPEIKEGNVKIAKYSLAVDGYGKDAPSNFINCVAFDKNAEFVERFLQKGTKILIEGRIQTGSYTNKEGQKVYTTDVIVLRHHFCESSSGTASDTRSQIASAPDLSASTEAFPWE